MIKSVYGWIAALTTCRAAVLADEPVAVFQDLVDFVGRSDAPARRPAEAQGRGTPRAALLDGLGLPARIAHGMALDVFQRIRHGEETAAQTDGTDGAVIDRINLAARAQALGLEAWRNAGIRGSKSKT